MNPRPWLVVSGALAIGAGVGAGSAALMTDTGGQSEIVGPGIVLTAEPSAEPDPTPSGAGEPAAPTTPAESDSKLVASPTPPTSEQPAQPAPAQPAPAPPPAPQPVDDADSPDEMSDDDD